MLLRQRLSRAAEVVHPVSRFIPDLPNVPLCALGELQALQLHDTILFRSVGEIDALVDGETRDLPQVVVAVRPNGADAIGREGRVVGERVIDGVKAFFSLHVFCSQLNWFKEWIRVSQSETLTSSALILPMQKSYHFTI